MEVRLEKFGGSFDEFDGIQIEIVCLVTNAQLEEQIDLRNDYFETFSKNVVLVHLLLRINDVNVSKRGSVLSQRSSG